MKTKILPLLVKTPDSWGKQALSKVNVLLNDHAHLEKKAASNALDILPCWPGARPPPRWISLLCSIAVDEVQHLAIVARLLERRGEAMTRSHRNAYAQGLRDLVRRGEGPRELVDRLLVSALIEARSCERFEILSRLAQESDLSKLYRSLWASEHGHYSVFLELAGMVLAAKEVQKRWKNMLRQESDILIAQDGGARMHSWLT